MNDTQVKVGAVVPWSQVPDGAMVRWLWDGHGPEYFCRRHEYSASLVGSCEGVWCPAGRDDGSFASSESVTVVALGLTGKESAANLRRLAEVFEIREHLMRTGDDSIWYGQDLDELAPLLQAAGWRPDMSAEDAARLLAARDADVRARVAGHLEEAVRALAELCRTVPIAECPPHMAAVRRLAALAVEYGSQDPRLHPDRVHALLAR